jgi:hypothetical protein
MGYRLRIGKISKKAHEKYKDLATVKDVCKAAKLKEGYSIVYQLPEYTDIFELGKWVDYSEGASNFFKFDLGEEEFSIVSKQWLLKVIEDYRQSTITYYKELYNSLETVAAGTVHNGGAQTELRQLNAFFNSKLLEWGWWLTENEPASITPYILDKGHDGPIVSSWKFEYAIFNLVHILHVFNWDKDLLIYSGW